MLFSVLAFLALPFVPFKYHSKCHSSRLTGTWMDQAQEDVYNYFGSYRKIYMLSSAFNRSFPGELYLG